LSRGCDIQRTSDSQQARRESDPATGKGAARKQALVDAAREVFEDKGFIETRVSDLLKRAGVSHGTYYDPRGDAGARGWHFRRASPMHSRWNHGSPDEARRQARAAEGLLPAERRHGDGDDHTHGPTLQLAAADHDILRTLG
jgi:hypothetical protein